MTLYEIYKSILEQPDIWSINNKTETYDINSIFEQPNSYNYLFEEVFWNSNYRDATGLIQRFKSQNDRIKHTISLYLLGLWISDRLGFKNIKCINWNGSAKTNFIHQWGGVCLFHDIGYFIENDRDNYPIADYPDIDALKEKFNIENDLREKSRMGELIDSYYNYRIHREDGTIDHGLVGAMLVFDRIIKRNNKMKDLAKNGAAIISPNPMFGPEIEAIALLSAESIARHNMFSSKEEALYTKYHLESLIQKPDDSHKITVKDYFTFLLCLIDSIEPVKCNGYCDPIKILQSIELYITKDNDKLLLQFSGEIQKMNEKAKELNEWLDVCYEFDVSSSTMILTFELNI